LHDTLRKLLEGDRYLRGGACRLGVAISNVEDILGASRVPKRNFQQDNTSISWELIAWCKFNLEVTVCSCNDVVGVTSLSCDGTRWNGE